MKNIVSMGFLDSALKNFFSEFGIWSFESAKKLLPLLQYLLLVLYRIDMYLVAIYL